jgi:hypothetical protein
MGGTFFTRFGYSLIFEFDPLRSPESVRFYDYEREVSGSARCGSGAPARRAAYVSKINAIFARAHGSSWNA